MKNKTLLQFISEHDILRNTMKYIISDNLGNFNPYHNFNHNLFVADTSYNNGLSHNLPESDLIILIIAGLFHDMGHIGNNKQDDSVNIKIAISMLDDFYYETLHDWDSIDINRVHNLIYATKFPYYDDMSVELLEEIIRDSDMLYTFNYDYFQNIILGLAKEFNMNVYDRLVQQIPFIENMKFYTDYANNIYNENVAVLIDELKNYKSILK